MKYLKIAILAQLDSPTITEQLAPVLRSRGHCVDILDLSAMPYEDFVAQPEIQALLGYDLLYYRSGLDHNGESKRVIELEEFLADSPVHTVNLQYAKHPLAHNKTYETKHAAESGLLIPKSVYEQTADFSTISTELGSPFISKTNYGTRGTGVHLVANTEEFEAVKKQHPNSELLHQEFITHDFEYRVHTLGGTVICISKKAPAEGDFRTNEALGGKMIVPDDVHTKRLHALAATTFTAFGFENFVVDFMLEKNSHELYFTEINLNPGWGETDLASTGIDMIAITADYFEGLCA